MFDRLFRRAAPEAQPQPSEAQPGPSRTYEVGWLFHNEKSSVIWDAPRPARQDAPQTQAAKSVAFCPAVIEFDRRHFVIPCPVDIHLRLSVAPDGKLNMTNVLGETSPVRQATLGQMLVVMPQNEWRHPQRPVIQMATPYLFVSDDPVYINQFPPFLHYGQAPLPGVQLCGRFPIDVWPRHMMWALEWHDLSRDLVLKRGDPWFYVRFEGGDPSAQVRLFEAEKTPELESYLASITDVTNYVNRTFSLMKTARERRPEKLVFPKKR
ncbi:MAG: hypothetical protein M3N07_05335 [Pseudomonadota bacterium]|nr:hypothetical protein [Pseudomonadota bacterium]